MHNLRERYLSENAWGLLTSINIYGCDGARIRDKKIVAEYCAALCKVIDMTPYGEPMVVHFGKGETEGLSLVQLIETSLISAHFANESNRAFIDIFSCKYYEPEEAARFSVEFFRGTDYTMNVLIRS